MSNFYFSLENDPNGGPLDDFFNTSLNKTIQICQFFACLLPLLLCLRLFNIIKYTYLHTWTHRGPVHVFCHPYKNRAETQLVCVAIFIVVVGVVPFMLNLKLKLSLEINLVNYVKVFTTMPNNTNIKQILMISSVSLIN